MKSRTILWICIVLSCIAIYLNLGEARQSPVVTCMEQVGGESAPPIIFASNFAACSMAVLEREEAEGRLKAGAEAVVQALEQYDLYEGIGPLIPDWAVRRAQEGLDHRAHAANEIARLVRDLPGRRVEVREQEKRPGADGNTRHILQFWVVDHYEAANRVIGIDVRARPEDEGPPPWTIVNADFGR